MEIFHRERVINFKIVYYGPALGGKSTNLFQTFARLQPQQKLTNAVMEIPTDTDRTLKYEFLPLAIGQIGSYQARFAVYTVPGQVYYEASRKLILKNVDGVVFVADSQKGKYGDNLISLLELERNLEDQQLKLYEKIPLVLQFNKQDAAGAMGIEEMTDALQKNEDVPVFAASARTGEGVMETFQTIIRTVVSNVKVGKPSVKV